MAGAGKACRVTCKCADIPFSFEPHRERAADETMIARYSATAAEAPGDKITAIYSKLSRHEAAHVVAAVAFGKTIDHVTLGEAQPHMAYRPLTGRNDIQAEATIQLAGLTCDHPDGLRFGDVWHCVYAAQDGFVGLCDTCRASRLFVLENPERPFREHVASVFDAFDMTADIFRSPAWSGALDALSAALERETLLTGVAIAEIVRPFDLTKPLKSISPIWTNAS